MIDMENGHWAYGSAISPTVKTQREQFKEDVESQLDLAFATAKGKILRIVNSGCLDIETNQVMTVLSVSSALLRDQSEDLIPSYLLSGTAQHNFKSEVVNILKFV